MSAMIERLLVNDKQLYLTLNAVSKSNAIARIMHVVTHLGATATAIFAHC